MECPCRCTEAFFLEAGTVDRLLPRAAGEARAEPTLSRQGRQRLTMLRWHEDRGRNAVLTCRHFGVSRDTFYRWWRRYQRAGPRALEDRSHRPRRVRQPTWSRNLAQAVLRVQTRAELVRLYERLQTTVIYVTHDRVEAMTMGSRIAVLNFGVLQQVDTPQQLYNQPANLFVAGFIGSPTMNSFVGVLVQSNGGIGCRIGDMLLKLDKSREEAFAGHIGE